MGAYESSRLETEVLPVAAKSNVNHVVVSASQASAGKGTNLQTTATHWESGHGRDRNHRHPVERQR
jgi:hypothetical protein